MTTTASAIAALDDAIATLIAHRTDLATSDDVEVDEDKIERIENDAHWLTGFEGYAAAFAD